MKEEKVIQLDLFYATNKVDEDFIQRQHDKKYQEKPLSPKDWELYRLVYHNSIVEGRKTTQREICDKISEFKWNDDPFAHDKCSAISGSVHRNNLSGEHEKIIIYVDNECWIGNQEETQEFLDKLWSDLFPRLNRFWKYTKKLKENGQGKLISCQGEPIDESSQAREFVESYGTKRIS